MFQQSNVQKKEYKKEERFSSHPTSKEVTTEEVKSNKDTLYVTSTSMEDIRNVFDSSEDEVEVEIINNDQKEEGEYVTMDETQPACTMCGRNSANDLEDITEKELEPEMLEFEIIGCL